MESSTQTLALTVSAKRTGSPSGTRITLVAHPLDAIHKALTKSRLFGDTFTGLVLPKDRLNELQNRCDDLFDHSALAAALLLSDQMMEMMAKMPPITASVAEFSMTMPRVANAPAPAWRSALTMTSMVCLFTTSSFSCSWLPAAPSRR